MSYLDGVSRYMDGVRVRVLFRVWAVKGMEDVRVGAATEEYRFLPRLFRDQLGRAVVGVVEEPP